MQWDGKIHVNVAKLVEKAHKMGSKEFGEWASMAIDNLCNGYITEDVKPFLKKSDLKHFKDKV